MQSGKGESDELEGPEGLVLFRCRGQLPLTCHFHGPLPVSFLDPPATTPPPVTRRVGLPQVGVEVGGTSSGLTSLGRD